MFLTAALTLSTLALTPCDVPRARGPAVCGTYLVWEDRVARKGRQIPINVIVLKSTGLAPRLDPLVLLQGGPGDAPSFNAAFYDRVFAAIRDARDLVLIDPRGTGGSAPLTCPELAAPGDGNALNAHWLDPAGVRACRARLERRTDLRQYTTAAVADDLREILGALGYRQVNLYGTSYGTRLAQVFMARHPDYVRTATLKGIVPPSDAMPSTHAPGADNAWRALVGRCMADTTCAAAFPRLGEDFDALLAELDARPPRVDVTASATRPAATIEVTRGLFAESFRNLLYTPQAAAGIPKLVTRWSRGDRSALTDLIYSTRTLTGSDRVAGGFFLSVTCTEDLPYVSSDEAARARKTFSGEYRLREQIDACRLWPRGRVPRDHRQPLSSSIPTLLISGESDPVTPPAGGEDVLRTLRRGRAVVLRNNGHPIGTADGCVAAMMGTLLESGGVAAIDDQCARAIPAAPFDTSR